MRPDALLSTPGDRFSNQNIASITDALNSGAHIMIRRRHKCTVWRWWRRRADDGWIRIAINM